MPSLPLRARTSVKSAVRSIVRKVGYEIGPLSTSFSDLQRALLARCDGLIDVGANTGQYVDLVRALGYEGWIRSYEPSSEAYAVLSRRAAGDPRWTPQRLALGGQEGTATLHVSANSVSSSVLPVRGDHVRAAPKSATVAHEQVPMSTLDAQLADVAGERLWVKLDVQGAEGAVLRCALATLRRTSVVQSEMSLLELYEGQTDYLELCELRRRQRMRLVHVSPGFQDPHTGELLQMDGLFVRDED